ncbi:MAG: YARHG domain-containing protein [Bacteroidetes bacterium]|nr:YARHG domain-containing protein [Bacteroidota bacterium]
MKIHFTKPMLLFSFFLIMSCGNQPQPSEQPTDTSSVQDTSVQIVVVPPAIPPADLNPDGIGGLYVGSFDAIEYKTNKRPSYSNRITISIDSVVAGNLYGHSIVAGNMRAFTGAAQETGKVYSVTGQEPGDDQYDGSFEFKIYPDLDSIEGTWTANNKKLAVTKRKYALSKREFKYDASLELPDYMPGNALYSEKNMPEDEYGEYEALTDDVLKINASKNLLKKADVENMHKGDLEVIRNAMYARHGYSFKNRKMRYVFDNVVDWYIPLNTDVRDMLTEVERKNEDLLKRYENHATKYYDSFGR